MLAVLLSLAAAVGYGISDFTAGLASRQASVILITFWSALCSSVLVLAVLACTPGHSPSLAALAWGVAAGLGGMTGALALYVGYRQAAFSVAGPLSAVSAAGLAVIVGVALGERPSTLSLAGIAVALPAIVLVSITAAPPGPPGPPDEAGASDPGEASGPAAVSGPAGAEETAHQAVNPWSGVGWGLAAGAGFALLFIALDRAGSGSGIWPVASGQVAELVVLGALVAGTRGWRGGLAGHGGWSGTGALAAVTGLTGGGATILYFFATHNGFLAITAVLTSLYPAVTIGLARLLASERLSAARLAGLILAAASVTLIALGGTA